MKIKKKIVTHTTTKYILELSGDEAAAVKFALGRLSDGCYGDHFGSHGGRIARAGSRLYNELLVANT